MSGGSESAKPGDPALRGPGPGGLVMRVLERGSSYGIAVVVLVLLTVVVWLGTLAQVDHTLYEVQNRYFESFGLIHWTEVPNPFSGVDGATAPVGIPLPGGYLLMLVLFVNMFCGLVVKVRKDWRRAGMVIVHGSVLFLLLAGWVSFRYKKEGAISLFEGESSNVFTSYHDWDVEVMEEGAPDGELLLIPYEEFKHLDGDERRTFTSSRLPFSVEVHHWVKNALPARAEEGAGNVDGMPVVDGIYLAPQPLNDAAEQDRSGVYVTAVGDSVESGGDGVLAELSWYPHTVTTTDGKRYSINLRRRSWQLPFTIQLDKFNRILHPNSEQVKEFSSEVTKIEGDEKTPIVIEMNEPLRHEGYALFQSSWNQSDDGRLLSQFAVVDNPSDQWPTYFVYIVTGGLMLHFAIKMFVPAAGSRRRKPAKAAAGAASSSAEPAGRAKAKEPGPDPTSTPSPTP